MLRKVYESAPGDFPFEIKKEQININLISNYIVNYIDEFGKSFFHKVYTVTNSPVVLRQFVFKALEILVKNQIELGGGYRYLWAGREVDNVVMRTPLAERNAQPLINIFLKPTFQVKGVQISREIVSGNGSLDYLCSYTRNDRLFKVGIELKNAHRSDDDLFHGLTKQLPAYLKGEMTEYGIYLVLWYKDTNHPFPDSYTTPDELRHALQEKSPTNYHIQVMVIDCTKMLSPSKL
jgi:hypothetical protein